MASFTCRKLWFFLGEPGTDQIHSVPPNTLIPHFPAPCFQFRDDFASAGGGTEVEAVVAEVDFAARAEVVAGQQGGKVGDLIVAEVQFFQVGEVGQDGDIAYFIEDQAESFQPGERGIGLRYRRPGSF